MYIYYLHHLVPKHRSVDNTPFLLIRALRNPQKQYYQKLYRPLDGRAPEL